MSLFDGLVECVPNVSEGRDARVIERLERTIREAGSLLLDTHTDGWHNRSVFTFVGDPQTVHRTALALADVATADIDLNRHTGVHPRMGALDVLPFVALDPSLGAEVDELVVGLASHIAGRLRLPVFLYGASARSVERSHLYRIRGAGFESLRQHSVTPDFGPDRLHPTAGALATGRRGLMVAYNILLDSEDIAIARRIASQIRESAGGMPGLQARGFEVAGRAQVSMNLHQPDRLTLPEVYRGVDALARAEGTETVSSEIVGLIPSFSAGGAESEDLRLPKPIERYTLEYRIENALGGRDRG